EHYYWDLRPPVSECTAVLHYNIKGGSVAHFAVNIPDTLEPRGVEVSGDDPKAEEGARPRIKDWRLAPDNGTWRLHVLLGGPATGERTLTVRLLPRQAFGPGTVRLALLQPIGAQITDGLVAYRVEGLDARAKPSNLQTQVIAPEQFAQEWQKGGLREVVAPTHAYSFGARQGESVLLVTLAAFRPTVEQDLHWQVFAERAELQATLKATVAGPELHMLEWDVPPGVTVAEVSGDNVRGWTRPPGEARIQIWFKQPARTATLHLRGWAVYAKPPAPPVAAMRWSVPVLRCPDAATTRTVLRVADVPGVHAEADAKTFLNLVPQGAPAATWVCTSPQGVYRAEFVRRLVPLPPRLLGVTTVEVRDGALHVAGSWEVHIPHGGDATFRVRIANWQGPLKLDGPGVSA